MKIFVLPIEPIETRYTQQWYDHVPQKIAEYCFKNEKLAEVINIAGDFEKLTGNTTPGAFLNFNETNIWKSSQLINLLSHKISDGDVILITDAWNPIIIQLKYILSLQNIKAKLAGIWHAGSYDPSDFLGRLIGDTPWVRHAERAMFESYDYNFFATDFHKDMFMKTFGLKENLDKFITCGFPFEYMEKILAPYIGGPKRNQIVFPHRIAPEKQVEIFRDLSKELPEYDWLVCQDKKLTKHQYHMTLAESKIVFSANLQETLGISSIIEGPLCECIPFVPNRLSYTEILENHNVLYQSKWTENWESYIIHKRDIVEYIRFIMNNYDTLIPKVQYFTKNVLPKYTNSDKMFSYLVK